MAGTYYLRGPIASNFFFEVRGVSTLYYSILGSVGNREYILFNPTYIYSDIISFNATLAEGGYIFQGEVAGRSFYLAVDEEGFLVPSKEGTVLLPLTEQAVNFSLFLAGIPFHLIVAETRLPAVFRIRKGTEVDQITEFYVLPRNYYVLGNLITYPEILATESNWFQGKNVGLAYTDKADSGRTQLVAYTYCKESLCAKPCKGGCSNFKEICLTRDPGVADFYCTTTTPVTEIPYYKNPTFIAAATTVGVVLVLSLILLGIVLALRK